MKKQYIIIILIGIVVVVVLGCLFFFKGKSSEQNNNLNPQVQNQNTESATLDSLSIGNWVSIVAEKSSGSYVASMIMACESKDSCQANKPAGDKQRTAPSGEAPIAPTANTKPTGNMENKTMLSGTITEINSDNMVLSLDTGETATVSISNTTRINKK
jgi:hypothetical protein